jgi:hypothetical protein
MTNDNLTQEDDSALEPHATIPGKLMLNRATVRGLLKADFDGCQIKTAKIANLKSRSERSSSWSISTSQPVKPVNTSQETRKQSSKLSKLLRVAIC